MEITQHEKVSRRRWRPIIIQHHQTSVGLMLVIREGANRCAAEADEARTRADTQTGAGRQGGAADAGTPPGRCQ